MPLDRGIIDQQLQALGEGSTWWERRELRDLPTVLQEEERILAMARGRITRRDPLRRHWLITVTDRRLLCLRSAGGSGWRQLEVPAHQITRTALRLGPLRARVLVTATGSTQRLYVTRPDGYKLMSALSKIGSPTRETVPGFGPVLMVRRVIGHVLDLPAVALGPGGTPGPAPAPTPALTQVDDRVQSLESEVEELRQQVQFLEQLLQQKHGPPSHQRLGSG